MIDWTQIKQLKEDVGAEDLVEVVELFIEEVDEAVEEIRDASNLDSDILESRLHFLKGSAANLGFKDFSELCSKGEKMAHDGLVDQFDLTTVAPLYDASKAQFLIELPTEVGINL